MRWAQPRHLGRRRAQLITAATASVQRVRDFLSVAWPVAPEACAHPFESVTWLAAMRVVTSRCGGQPEKLAAVGLAEFTALVRQAVAGWGGQRPASLVCRAVFAALASTEGVVVSHRRALLRWCADAGERQFVFRRECRLESQIIQRWEGAELLPILVPELGDAIAPGGKQTSVTSEFAGWRLPRRALPSS